MALGFEARKHCANSRRTWRVGQPRADFLRRRPIPESKQNMHDLTLAACKFFLRRIRHAELLCLGVTGVTYCYNCSMSRGKVILVFWDYWEVVTSTYRTLPGRTTRVSGKRLAREVRILPPCRQSVRWFDVRLSPRISVSLSRRLKDTDPETDGPCLPAPPRPSAHRR